MSGRNTIQIRRSTALKAVIETAAEKSTVPDLTVTKHVRQDDHKASRDCKMPYFETSMELLLR